MNSLLLSIRWQAQDSGTTKLVEKNQKIRLAKAKKIIEEAENKVKE